VGFPLAGVNLAAAPPGGRPMDRPRKRGSAAQAQQKLRARQSTLLRWQRLLAITMEYIYSVKWAQQMLMKSVDKVRGEMKRWPASPKLQAGFDTAMTQVHKYLLEHIPKENRRPSWPVSRKVCRHRDGDGKATTKEYKAAGSVWRRCNGCGSRWKFVDDVWEEVEPIPYPGGSAPTSTSLGKSRTSSLRSAGLPASQASSGACPRKRPSAAPGRTSPSTVRSTVMEVDLGLPPLPTGPEHHSMSTDQEDVPTVATLPVPDLSEDELAAARPDSWEQLESET